jgi:hypothetical protein
MATKRQLVGVWKKLADQHAQLAALLEQVRASDGNRAEVWAIARAELLSHERGELREVYPVLRQYAELRALADGHDADATTMERMVLALSDLPVESEIWMGTFAVLCESVLRHAAEEEQDVFPKAQSVIGEELSMQLDMTFTQAKQQLAAQWTLS